jgi:anti-sigma B factor antagonist
MTLLTHPTPLSDAGAPPATDSRVRLHLVTGSPKADAFADWENEGGHLIDRDVPAVSRPRRNGQVDERPPTSSLRSESRTTLTDGFPLGTADRSKPTTIGLSGEIDMYTSAALRARLEDVLRSSTPLLVLNLSAVSFCDASGLAVIVGIQRRARVMGITLALAAPCPSMYKLLHITGLDRSLPVM